MHVAQDNFSLKLKKSGNNSTVKEKVNGSDEPADFTKSF